MKKTRKPIALLLSVLMLLALFELLGVVSFAADDETPEDDIVTVVETGDCGAEGSDVQYTLYSDGTMIVEGRGKIRDEAFEGGRPPQSVSINKVILREGITEVGSDAFYHSGVATLVLPDSLKTIGFRAFSTNSIHAIQFGNAIETIDFGAFGLCFSNPDTQKTLIFPESLKILEWDALDYCNNLQTLVFGSQVETLGESVLTAAFDLENVVFLNGNTALGYDFDSTRNELTYYSYAGGTVEAAAEIRGARFVDLATVKETDHDWDEGTVTKLPTCTEPGEMTYLCKTNPSHRKTETIPATGNHVYKETIKPTAYCKDGSRTLTCIYCGDVKTETLPAPFMHTYDDGVITTEPTCTEPGRKTQTCIYCGDEKTEMIPAIGHSYAWTITRNSTDTEAGTALAVCANDPTHTKSYIFPAHGPAKEHIGKCGKNDDEVYSIWYENDTFLVFGEGEMTDDGGLSSQPYTSIILDEGITNLGNSAFSSCYILKKAVLASTVTSLGTYAFYGDRSLEQVVILNGNAAIADNCFDNLGGATPTIYSYPGGSVEAFANEKGLRFVPLDEDGHAWDAGEITMPATCGTDGVRTFTCAVCGDTYTETIPATGEHIYTGIVTTPAGCETAGVETYTCAVCGDTYTAPLAATGHSWGPWVTVSVPTHTTQGLAVRTCQNDPSHTESQILAPVPPADPDPQPDPQPTVISTFTAVFHDIIQTIRNLLSSIFGNLFG